MKHSSLSFQKTDKTSPRWQHSDMYMKEQPDHKAVPGESGGVVGNNTHRMANGVTGLSMGEDERDPDVIPAQFVPSNLDASETSSNQWTDPYLLEKFANHESRPSNLLLKPMSGTLPMPPNHHNHHHQLHSGTATTGRGVTMMMTTTASGTGLNLQQQHPPTSKTGLSPYFHSGPYHPTQATTVAHGGRDSAMTTTTNLVVQNGAGGSGGDLDINVNVIKNMLLANRVPESCV